MSAETTTFEKYLAELRQILSQLPLDRLHQICDILYRAYEDNRTVFIFGNGGSAALASHMACDLGKGTHAPCPGSVDMKGVKRLKVFSVTHNVPMITAWANDSTYEDVFCEQIENFIQSKDVAFGISGSGNSPNVLKALKLARAKGAITVGFTGFQGGKMKDFVDYGVVVPSNSMQQIEDVHLILAHVIFLDLRRRILDSHSPQVQEMERGIRGGKLMRALVRPWGGRRKVTPTKPEVVNLCVGTGTRLHEETEFRPKPLVEVGCKPILWHIMKINSNFRFRDFVLCLG
jgi:D-sedoheptulose 7-phosphate isomerase